MTPLLLHVEQNTGEFRCTGKAVYQITESGRRIARWAENAARINRDSPNASSSHLPERNSSEHNPSPKDLDDAAKVRCRAFIFFVLRI